MIRRPVVFKTIASIVLGSFLIEVLAPSAAIALTSGPSQPEFSSFEPVATTGMVSEFTGSFTYNLPVLSIPGPNGSGYALSLSYHGGVAPEEEASWVGSGFTLNPGAINRQKRGFPDDYNGYSVRYWNKVRKNWTVSVGLSAGFELFSVAPVSVSTALRYNNYKGFSTSLSFGANLSYKGIVGLGYSYSDGEGSFSYSVVPSKLLSELGLDKRNYENAGLLSDIMTDAIKGIADVGMDYANYSVADDIRPTNITSYTGESYSVSISGMGTPSFLPAGIDLGINGSYTWQANDEIDDVKAYGYMYSSGAGGDDMMDYYVEREGPYTKRDAFLPIPFSNADYFAVAGEGIGGGFRLYNKKPGHFHLNHKENEMMMYQIAVGQVHIGAELGIGGSFGVGRQTLQVNNWNDPNRPFAAPADHDEPFFFRMNNDLGGVVSFGNDDNAVRAGMNSGGFWGFATNDPVVGQDIYESMNEGARSGRSTYVGYHTNWEMIQSSQRTVDGVQSLNHFRSYTKDPPLLNMISRSYFPDLIGEFSMVSPDGQTYVYGLPVFSRNEKSLQYGLTPGLVNQISNNYLVYGNITKSNAPMVVGDEQSAPYATTYLLTEIMTPDYVDRTNDGPTDDDLGGYTRFRYDRVAGGYSGNWYAPPEWYRWRTPYNGLLYDRRMLSDEDDDVGTVASGEKEIYYLKSIETKTHIAVFVRNDGVSVMDTTFVGSGQERKDGYAAVADEKTAAASATATTAQSGTIQAANKLKRLERIELWSKKPDGTLGKLIQTVHFDYDYSLCRNLPNSFKESGNPDSEGKLTLRRIYFEYNGVVSARISPYVFGYSYRQSTDYGALPDEVQTKYQDIIEYADDWSSSEQNPAYSPFHIDRWGNYQYDGANRHDNKIPWVNQNPDMAAYDPAAWQLKWIRLPSGGEIHIQYEQNEYCYVQDRPAMAMVRLTGMDNYETYYLDLSSDLGIDHSSADAKKLMEIVRHRFKDPDGSGEKERIYGKFLYSLTGLAADIDKCNSEYISGYFKVADAGVDGMNRPYIKFHIDPADPRTQPLKVLSEFVNSSRNGVISEHCGFPPTNAPNAGDATERVKSLYTRFNDDFDNAFLSPSIDYPHSYIRIPLGGEGTVIRAKKGGGLRVKRILMYDKGVEDGAASLYGTEYIYQTVEGYSSGVATNEPSEGREENAVVNYLEKRRDKNWLQRIITGRDKDQFEGPIGESLLPGPSVGYSRVVAKSIHDGKTSSGFAISEFYTCKDYPFKLVYSTRDIDETMITPVDQRLDWIKIPAVIFNYNRANIWATQGYSFVLNGLHGQVKKVAAYGGDYSAAPTTWAESSSQEYVYFAPGEPIPMMHDVTGELTYENPGKEMEVVSEGRSVEDVTIDGKLSGDVGIGFIPFLPFVTFWGSGFGTFTYSEEKMRTHVTSKVVRYPVILRKTIARQDGITHVTENVAFNPETGTPVETRTTDGYAGLTLEKSPSGHDRVYTAYSLPASQEYTAMGQKAATERAVLTSVPSELEITKAFQGSSHYLSIAFKTPGAVCNLLDIFTPGDLIYVSYGNLNLGIYNVESTKGNRVMLLPTSYSIPSYYWPNVTVEIIRSGRTNQLTTGRGGFTTYDAEP